MTAGRTDCPHLTGETAATYDYTYRRGAMVGIDVNVGGTTRAILADDGTTPGISYHPSGAIHELRFGNGLLGRTAINDASLPETIEVEDAQLTSLFSTGTYDYDGARNIKQIGNDLYRYDEAMRLDWAKVESSTRPTFDIDYVYDRYGNMTDRSVSDGVTTDPTEAPVGLHFTSRTHAGNRIADSGYDYDDNGNLLNAPDWSSDTPGTWLYRFTPENRIAMIQAEGSGKVRQHARFDASGHRWAREGSDDGGMGHVSLRDASGQVVAEYLETSANSGLELEREYVRGGPGLIAEHSACGPRPALALNTPYESGSNVRFKKTDYVDPTGSYTILIQAADGRQKVLTRPSTLANEFDIPIPDLYEGVDNFVRLQTEAACGVTGFGNAVSYHRTSASGCLQTMTSYRTQLGDGDDLSHLHIATSSDGCAQGTLFRMYFEREGTTQPVSLNPFPVPITQVIIPNLPAGASHGRYWVSAIDPQTGMEFTDSPAVADGLHSTGADTGSEPGEASRNLRFAHLDHLGSTRMITDEAGAVVAKLKFYPFGMEAETAGGDATRMKFTGHERDDDVALDYMLARFYGAGLARFLSVDPVIGAVGAPDSWNRFAYVLNNPIRFIDPSGKIVRVPKWLEKTIQDGREQSAEFRGTFDKLDGLKNVEVVFGRPTQASSAFDTSGDIKVYKNPETGEVTFVGAQLFIPMEDTFDIVLVGHELEHVEETVDTGKTPDRIEGAREVSPGHWETPRAKEASKKIKRQRREHKKAKSKARGSSGDSGTTRGSAAHSPLDFRTDNPWL